jgi:formylmethanofuran dehydrogenase subunit C
MQTTSGEGSRRLAAAQTAIGKRFGRFDPEKERAVREGDIRENEVLESLKTAWKGFKCKITGYPSIQNYMDALAAIKDQQYSSDDVEMFTLVMAEFQDEAGFSSKAGVFLSALINEGEEDNYRIRTRHLKKINYLGYKNTKNIAVIGDVGFSLGMQMEAGKISVSGDAGDGVGSWMENGLIVIDGSAHDNTGFAMQGGLIVVNRDIGNSAGHGMRGGKIVVKGDVGYFAGCEMIGGTIEIEGDAGDFVCPCGGTIIIHGNAGEDVGKGMMRSIVFVNGDVGDGLGSHLRGGIIVVGGNVLGEVGAGMKGGSIFLAGDGNVAVGSGIERGKIYHKGELIVDK